MSVVIVKRPARALPPTVPSGEVRLEAPPEIPRGQEQSLLMNLLPMLGMGSSAAFFFMPGAQPFMKVMGGLMVASTLAMVVAQVVRVRQGNSGQLGQARRDYLKYLAQIRRQVRETATRQRAAQFYTHPAPDQLWSVVAEGRRVWERRPGDGDFVQIRLGLGSQQLATALIAPQTAPVDELEPLTAHAMQQFLATHASLDGLPLAVSLRAFYHLTISGDTDTVYGTARAMLAQLATLHSPEDLVIAVAAAPGNAAEWEWIKWLPHATHRTESDGAGPVRLISGDLATVERLLEGVIEGRPRFNRDAPPLVDLPHLVLVLDGPPVPPDSVFAASEGLLGVSIVEVISGELDELRGGLSVRVTDRQLRLTSAGGAYAGTPDALGLVEAESLARQLAPLRVSSGGDDDEPLLANLDFTDLMGIGDADAVDPARTWRPRSLHDRLRVPIGVGEDGDPVMLDLKEAAQEGMGPHGLCVGATGSGKSELLRTLVLGLAVTHSSETLNFILADFKGGATFTGMSDLPHVAAVITNLADDLTLVDRMHDAITGEIQRRQELLRAAGNFANIHDYERARAAGAALAPLATLVIVLDEFSELLTAKPEFIDMFLQIGRIGRSLGVHLLLASQRLEEGRLRGLDTYLSYRIGLRTFSAGESRAAIGVPDAYHLPSVPGSGYLKFDTESMVRFKAAYVSGVHRSTAGAGTGRSGAVERRPVRFTAASVPLARATSPAPTSQPVVAPLPDDFSGETVLDVIVRRLSGQGPAAHQVWLPPLSEPPSVDQILPALNNAPGRGLAAGDHRALGKLVVPVGVVDKPFEQRRDPLYRDFSGAAGHGLIVGGPRSGKSTLLRTLISSFALTHTPGEVQFYCLDFGGGTLRSLDELPHVGGVAGRLDAERVRRTVAEVAGILGQREEFFRANGIDSIGTYRQRREAGQLPDQAWGDVFLVIDGWGGFRQDFEPLEPVVADIAARGLGYGVHLVVSAARYMEVRPALKDLLLGRLELRLGDPMDSEFDRKVAARIPHGTPGRGLTQERLHFLGALPRIDGSSETDGLAGGTAALVRAIGEAWTGPPAPRVRMLPRMLPADQLPKGFEHPEAGIAIGVDETSLAPVFLNFDTDPFLLVFGDSESGKTALLRLIAKQLSERYTRDEALLVVGDFRRSLLGTLPDTHVLEYAATSASMDLHMTELRRLMERRAPGPQVTAEQLRDRSWWSGPQLFILVDDYELVATSSGNPMQALVDHLPFARDVGLRFIITRSAGGAARAMYEPFLQRVKELGAQGILLSGDPSEGDLLGSARPRALPPGRGLFISRRRGAPLVQLGWSPDR